MPGQTPTGIMMIAPGTVRPGQPFELGIKVLCDPWEVPWQCYAPPHSGAGVFNQSPRGSRYLENTPERWTGRLRLTLPDGMEGPEVIDFADHTGPRGPGDTRPLGRFGPFKVTRAGHVSVRATIEGTDIVGTSNAIEATDELDNRLFWGDTHSQTFFSDGLRGPEELYDFARHESFLDFFALADHVERITDRQWDYFQAVTGDANDPGHFATLVGQEWTHKQLGHRNVYYPGDGGPVARCTAPDCDTLEKLYALARRHGALVIPHHPTNHRMGCDWSKGHDPEVERLVEIYSIWGNSERMADQGNPRPILRHGGEVPGQDVISALKMGRRLGFIGSGDIHDGRPGDEFHNRHPEQPAWDELYRQGIVGVWANELTREAIFDAMWNRRVYATTGSRTIVKFASDTSPMGSVLARTATAALSFEVAAEVPVSRIDVVKNGDDLVVLEPNEPVVQWSGHDSTNGQPAWYYIRVTRSDGEMAWSSPIWFTE